jgi:hypothetical protein
MHVSSRDGEVLLTAIQDSIAALNLIAKDIEEKRVPSPEHLERVRQVLLRLDELSQAAEAVPVRSDQAPSRILCDTVRPLNPALVRLLNELAIDEPDECDLAEVWIACCQGSAVVPVGVETEVRLGPWVGRTTRLAEVQLRARSLATNQEITGRFDDVGDALITRGMYIGLLVLVG